LLYPLESPFASHFFYPLAAPEKALITCPPDSKSFNLFSINAFESVPNLPSWSSPRASNLTQRAHLFAKVLDTFPFN